MDRKKNEGLEKQTLLHRVPKKQTMTHVKHVDCCHHRYGSLGQKNVEIKTMGYMEEININLSAIYFLMLWIKTKQKKLAPNLSQIKQILNWAVTI